MKAALLVAALALVAPRSASSQGGPVSTADQETSLFFQGEKLTLGMSESEVRQKLKDYTLKAPPATSSQWLIMTKSGPPFHVLGSVVFSNGVLVVAEAKWTRDDGHKDIDFADALYGSLASVERDGGSCVVHTNHRPEQPGFDLKSADIECAHRGVTVTIVRGASQYGESASVEERIFRGR